MTRRDARLIQDRLCKYGVYKPYVATDGATTIIESYPLTATITEDGVDPEMGPAKIIRIRDCSLPRIGRDSLVHECRIFVGQNAISMTADLLTEFHWPAHERAKTQDKETTA